MKLIAYMACFNEADYIEYAIRSTIEHVDLMIVIEGAWGESFTTSGKLRSDDGTIGILHKLELEFDNLRIYYHNEPNQLLQRTKIFDYINSDCYMLLQDGDEVYRKEDILKIKQAIKDRKIEDAARINSFTFVNDFYSVLEIPFPRIFKLKTERKYRFIGANEIMESHRRLKTIDLLDIHFHHYSYVKTPERFMEKKRERTKVHGQFKWELRDGLVQTEKANIKEYSGTHPEIMIKHPMYGVKKHKKIEAPETIVLAQHSGIGNLVLTTPCLKAIRELKPNAHIYLLTWPRAARILEGIDFVNDVVLTNNDLFINSLNREVDYFIYSPLGVAIKPDTLKRCKQVLKHDMKPPWGRHEIEVHMDFARRLGYKGETPHTEVKIFDYNYENARIVLDRYKFKEKEYICINASYLHSDHWPLKHWGNKNYLELLKNIQSNNIVFLGARADSENTKEIIKNYGNKHNIANLCGFFNDIKDSSAIIDLSKGIVGNDGGLMHIAAALEIPTVTIFTFTNPIKNMPVSKNASIIMNKCEQRIMCQHGHWKQCKERGCINVPVEKVLEKMKCLM